MLPLKSFLNITFLALQIVIICRILLLFHLALVRKHELSIIAKFADKTTVIDDDQILTVKKDANKKSRPDGTLFSILTDEINGVVGGGIISYYHKEDELYDDEVKGIKFGASSNEINLNEKNINNNILDCIYWTSFGTSSNELNLNENNTNNNNLGGIYWTSFGTPSNELNLNENNTNNNNLGAIYCTSFGTSSNELKLNEKNIIIYDDKSNSPFRAYSESIDDQAMACYDVICDDKRHLHDAEGKCNDDTVQYINEVAMVYVEEELEDMVEF